MGGEAGARGLEIEGLRESRKRVGRMERPLFPLLFSHLGLWAKVGR